MNSEDKLTALRKRVDDAVSAQRGEGLHVVAAPVPHPLDAVERFVGRFCSFRLEDERVAVTLWAAHAHMVDEFHTTPRLLMSSPEAGSGKTRVLEILDLLVPDPMFVLSASPAAIFRTLATRQVTLLVDEIDAVFTKRGADDSNEDLRAMFNAGYKRGATIPRCVGPRHDVAQFNVFAATAFAGLGDLPETIMSRSIIIRMRKRAAHELVEPFRTREHEAPGHALRNRLAEWASIVKKSCGAAWPVMPEGIVDGPAEVWEPLIAVADAAGGAWPDRARKACLALCAVAASRRASLGVRLLADLRAIFGSADALHTETILERLRRGVSGDNEPVLDADAPWNDLQGKPLGERGLATMLRKYEVKAVKVKVAGRALQGYRREHLWDAWQRYLPSEHFAQEVEPTEPAEPGPAIGARTVPEVPQVPDAMESVGMGTADPADSDAEVY